jgi:hypothetical protein
MAVEIKLSKKCIKFIYTVFGLSIILSLAITTSFLMQQQKNKDLVNKIIILQEEIKPLQEFYYQKDKLVNKESYLFLEKKYQKIIQEKFNLEQRIKENQQIIINLMHNLEKAKQNNLKLNKKQEAQQVENKNLKNNIDFNNLKLKD